MEKKIKVTIATGIYPPSIGGPAQYSELLFNKLPLYGCEIIIASFDAVRKYPKIIRHIVYMFLLCKKSWGSSIIYAQDPVSVGLPALIVSKITLKKFVLKVVGDYAWEQGRSRYGVTETLDEFVTKRQKNYFVRFLQRVESFVAKGADMVVTPSEYLKKIVITWGVSQDNIAVVYNAFKKPECCSRKEYGHIKHVLTVGRLVPWKGIIELIDVIVELRKIYTDITLDIIGSGPLEREIRLHINQKNADEYIYMKGQLDHNALYEEISMNDLFVLNTSYEGFSHLILENMALGTPIVTTEVGGNIEIIDHMSNGYLVQGEERGLKEAIEFMIQNPFKAREFAEQAKRDVDNYKEEYMLEHMSQILKHI